MKKSAMILMLLFALLLLSACHTDNDPWPIGDELHAPTATSLVTAAPTHTATPMVTQEPAPTPEPTEVPGGSEDPGING